MSSLRWRSLMASPYALALVGALFLMIYAFVNGYALFFNDSRSYVRGAAMGVEAATGVQVAPEWRSRTALAAIPIPISDTVAIDMPADPAPAPQQAYTANRSIYYGVLALAGYVLSDFWLTIYAQCFAVALACALLAVRGMGLSPGQYLTAMGVIGVTTSVGPIAALIMPDIFAGVMIACAGTLFAYWDRMRRLDRMVLFLLIAFAALSHASHGVVLAGLAVLILLVGLVFRTRASAFKAAGLVAAAIVVGAAGQVAFSKALEAATRQEPLLLPHITAHLQDLGPGAAYLKANCPEAGFAVCQYVDRLPMYWEHFLGADPKRGVFAVADLPTKRRISDEQIPFAIAVLKYDPVGLIGGLSLDALDQLTRFGLRNLQVTAPAMANYRSAFPANVADQIQASWAGRSPALLEALTLSTYVAAVLSVLALGVLLLRRDAAWTGSERDRYRNAVLVIVGGVLGNALVCGVLASPYDRFQARVVWLLPMVAILGLALAIRARAGDIGGGRAPG